jgi:hypothetical protein
MTTEICYNGMYFVDKYNVSICQRRDDLGVLGFVMNCGQLQGQQMSWVGNSCRHSPFTFQREYYFDIYPNACQNRCLVLWPTTAFIVNAFPYPSVHVSSERQPLICRQMKVEDCVQVKCDVCDDTMCYILLMVGRAHTTRNVEQPALFRGTHTVVSKENVKHGFTANLALHHMQTSKPYLCQSCGQVLYAVISMSIWPLVLRYEYLTIGTQMSI